MKLFSTKKRFLGIFAAIATVMTIGWALAAFTNVLNPVFGHGTVNADADKCITLTDGINVNAANANATVKLTGGCGTRKLVMKAWYAPSATGMPHEAQVKFAVGEPKTLNPGDDPYKLHVAALPQGCFYQYDVVDITLDAPGNGQPNPIVAAVTGGNRDCTPTPPPPAPTFACTGLTATPGIIDPATGNQSYTLTTTASVSNGTIQSYSYAFSNGNMAQFPSNSTSNTTVQTFAPGDWQAYVVVTVKGDNGQTYTTPVGAPCAANIHVNPPQSQLTCDSLTATAGRIESNGNQSYTFTAKATAKNTTITNYSFDFGTGDRATVVTTNANTATASHTFTPGEYDIRVTVNSANDHATSEQCKVHIKVSQPDVKLSCDNLTATPGAIDQTNGNQAFSFTANASAQNTTITSYVFDFGDNSSATTVNTAATTATTNHTYAPGDYTATVTVKTANDSKTSEACKVNIHVAQQQQSSLVCTSLSATPGAIDQETGNQAFSFNATASKANATITNYVFNFGDNSANTTVTTGDLSATADHTYAPGTYTATVKVNGTDNAGKPISSADTANCVYHITVKPPQPKNPAIKLTKVVDGVKYKQVAIGQHFVYQLVITNTGEKDLTNAKVTDPAPAGVTLLSADLGDIASNSFSYTIPSLKVGESVTVNITAVVNAYVAGNMVNTACVDTPDVEGEPDSCDTATVTVPPVVTPPTPPQVLGVTTLVNTGPGSIAAIAAAVAAISTIAYRFVLGRKLSN